MNLRGKKGRGHRAGTPAAKFGREDDGVAIWAPKVPNIERETPFKLARAS